MHGQEGQGAEAERKIADLNRRLADGDRRETELVALRLRDAVSEVALDRNAALLRVERTHLTEEMERQRETMSTLEQGQAAVASLEALREHMRDRLDAPRPRGGPPHCPGGPGDSRNGRSWWSLGGLDWHPPTGGRLCPQDPGPVRRCPFVFAALAPEYPHATILGVGC